MNQEQYQWLKDNGYDPAVYDVDDQGNVFENPVAVAEPRKKVMSPLRAGLTSFAGSVLPSAAGLGSAKLGMMAGAPFGPIGVGLGAIGGGLAGGYLAGKGQEAVLENYAPEAVAEMQRAQTDQPLASYAGGFLPNALAFRPSLQGMSGLLRPTVRGEETLRAALSNPNFLAPAANIAANVGASGAGQLLNVAEGGEFSAPRFAADVALGTLFNRPTALGRAVGFHDLPQTRPVESPELAPAREQAEFMAYPPREFVTPREERLGVGPDLEAKEQFFTPEGKAQTESQAAKDYTKWWKSETEPTTDLIKGAAESVKAKIPRERLAELAQDPEVGEVLRNPSKMQAFIAKQADQTLEQVYQDLLKQPKPFMELMAPGLETAGARSSSRQAATTPEVGFGPNVTEAGAEAAPRGRFLTAEEAAQQEAFQALRAERGLPSESPLSDVEAAYAERKRRLNAPRAMYGGEVKTPSSKGPSMSKVLKVSEEGNPLIPYVKVKNATEAAREIYTRLQRAPEAEQRITQDDINRANEIANRRGLKIELERTFSGGEEVRGMYVVDADGNRIVRVNPLMATPDTAIHEIGHDIFRGVTNPEMRRSLMETAADSQAFRDEMMARQAEVEAGKISAEEARNIALEEGLIQAFGEKMPGINRGELRSWFKAFKASMKQLVTGKMSPEDALAWMHYASTEAVPWKGVAVGKGGDVGGDEATRYQRPSGSAIKTPAELDYLVTKGGPFAEVARGLRDAYNTRDYKQGQWSSKYSLTTKLPEEARVRLLNHLAGEFDSGVLKAPASDIKAAYDQLRKEYLPAIVNDYNSKGFMVRDTAGLRARGSNPTYFPLHAVADEVKTILTTKQGSPEYTKLENDFKQWNTQLKQADGATLAEAKRYADEKFADMQNIVAKPPGVESGVSFAGARKPEGYPLPPSWRSDDIIDILNNYTRRSATDYAYQQHVESSPVAMAALGAKTMVNNQPIPANVLQSTPLIINEPSVQSILREYRGTPAQRTEGALQSFGRFVSAATIGPVSKVGDIGTSMFKGLAYLQGSEYAAGLADFTKRIGDWAALKERSYASGLNKRDAAENMRQVLGIAEDSTAFMDKAARVLSKVTFVNDIESAARVIAQGWGETVVGINKKLALGGDKSALQMLDTLSPDWRTRSDADLAAQVGRLLQGSYDMRQLPASVLEGAAAPYLTWSKWSIGQYDSFVKYAIQPAMQGNMKPLMGQMLIGLLGGGAVSAVQAWLNNREGKDITWKELEAWMQQNQGELGSDGGQLLAQKLLTMAQKMGTFGFAGDLVKMTLDAAAGGSSQGVATMPAVDAIYDVSKRTAAAIQALDDGEDFGLVMKALMKDSLVGHVQALRVARNWLDEDENLRYDDRRRQRLYDALSGLPSKGGAFSVNYSNLSEREFERGELGEGTGEEAMSLVRRAREQATTPEDYASRIRKLKTSQNQIMPSMERQPMKAARYLSWLEGTEEGKGGETMRRYMIREGENKYRKSLVEGLSGLR